MKWGIATDITFITLCSYHMPSYSSTTIVVVLSIMKKLCRMYKINVVTMNNISCNTFFFIKFRMYILRYIIFVVKNYNVYFFIKLIVTKWPYVNCIVWIMWLIFFYMTSTIGLCVLEFWGSFNVLLLVHFECIYQQMKLLGCIQITNRCRINSCKFKHPHINLWVFRCTQMVNRHIFILASSNTLTNEAFGGHSIGQ